jgi:hypothetical protein
MTRSKRRRRLFPYLALGMAALAAAAAPAQAGTIDVSRAADAVRAQAQASAEVERTRCWRPVVGGRRASHRALCVAWWVRTSHTARCAVFYEVRMSRSRSRRLVVTQTYQPWCASMPEPNQADAASRAAPTGLTLAAAERAARAALAPLSVDAVRCFRPSPARARGRALCLAAHPAPANQICRSLVDVRARPRPPGAVKARIIRLQVCMPVPLNNRTWPQG